MCSKKGGNSLLAFILVLVLIGGCQRRGNEAQVSSDGESASEQSIASGEALQQSNRDSSQSYQKADEELNTPCNPCRHEINSDLPDYLFTVESSADSSHVKVRVAKATNPQGTIQEVRAESSPALSEKDYFLKVEDVNFDGYNDAVFLSRTGGAGPNSYTDYWLFVPETGLFKHAGVYPTLNPDVKPKRLTAYLRGGHAGLIYEKRTYAPSADSLTLVHRVQQTHLRRDGENELYLRTAKQREDANASWRTTRQEIIVVRSGGDETRIDTLRPDSLR